MKTGVKVLDLIRADPTVTREAMASALELTINGVDWHIAKLKKAGRLRRIGPDKGGHWEVLQKQ